MKLSMAADTRHVGKLLGQSASKCFKLAFPNSPNLQIQPIGCPKAPSVSLESSVKGIQLRIDILKEELSLPSKPIKKSDIYASGQQNHNVEKGNRRNSYGETINSYINDGFEDFDLFAPPPTVIKKVIKKQPEPGKPDTSTRPKTPSTSSNQPSSYPLGARRSIGAQLRAAASVHDEKPKPSPTRVEAGGAWDEEPSTSYLKSLPMGEWERQAKALLRRKRQAELLSKKSEKTFEEQLGLDLSEDSMGHMSPARGPAPYGVPRPNGHSRMAFPYEAPKPKRPAGPPQAHGNWGRGQAQGPVQPAAAAAAGGVPAHWLKGHDDDDDDSDDEKLGAENEETLEELVKAHPHCSELVSYLRGLGMTESAFERIMKRHSQCLLTNAVLARERVEYLLSVGVKRANLCKLIVRHPQILEYRVEQMMKVRVRFLLSLGVPPAAIGGILTKSPTILECSVDRALQPRVRFLQEEVGIGGEDISKVVQRCPQVLTQSIEDSLRPRIEFLRDEVGIPFAALAQIVVRHPQLLHYSVEDGMLPRLAFLKSIGMTPSDIVKVLQRLPQVLSLSVETTLRPKYEYLVQELGGSVRTVTSFPAYFSLSLEQRIKPRHRHHLRLLARSQQQQAEGKAAPKKKKRAAALGAAFPMRLLAVNDKEFCKSLGCDSEEEYLEFRSMMLAAAAKEAEGSSASLAGALVPR